MTAYAFNPTGAAGANSVNGELQTLAPPSAGEYNFLIPISGPFFFDSLVVSIVPTAEGIATTALHTTTTLTPFVDYFPALDFIGATASCGRAVCGGISFTDPALAGAVTLNYLSLGGTSWQVSRAQQLAFIAAQVHNPRTTTYEDAFAITAIFPPTVLPFDEKTQVTLNMVAATLGEIAQVITQGTPPSSPISYSDHITDYGNPHKDTAATFGLQNVPNWRLSTVSEARAGASHNLFVSPLGAAQALTSLAVMPAASTTLFGLAKLNLGGIGDDTDNTKALTTSGLLNLKNAAGDNAVKALFSYERQTLQFSPHPIVYPTRCLGVVCNNFRELVNAVQANLNFNPIQYSALRGCIYLPHDMPTPNLTLTSV